MGLNIKSDRGRGGVIENVRMDHWTMDDVGRAINVTPVLMFWKPE